MYFDVAEKIFKDEFVEADKIAFVAADKEISWKELKTLSDKICGALDKLNLPKGYPVLVYGDKEAFFLTTLLSCYRNNLAFVPISPDLPEARIKKIIEQTKSEVMFVCGAYKNVPSVPVSIGHSLDPLPNPPPRGREFPADGTAYLLFTSGSSGEPKGVLISSENIISFSDWFVNNLPVTDKSIFINQASFSFDISLADFFGALQTGATVIFNTSEMVRNGSFFERIKKYAGTY